VRFTRLMLHDREFLHGEIKSHLTYIREVSRKALYKLERGRVRELVYWIPYILYIPNVALAKNKIRATERFSIYP
jgi:predicted transcriptional regulator